MNPRVLDAFEVALWSRGHEDLPVGDGLVMHSDASSQFTPFSFIRRLIEAGVDPSIGSVGDAYDADTPDPVRESIAER